MNAMVNRTQGGVLPFPTTKCHLCPNVYYHHMMFDAEAISPCGRVCGDCWNAYKQKSRKRHFADQVKKNLREMELVA